MTTGSLILVVSKKHVPLVSEWMSVSSVPSPDRRVSSLFDSCGTVGPSSVVRLTPSTYEKGERKNQRILEEVKTRHRKILSVINLGPLIE